MVALMPADGSRQQFYSFPRLAIQTVFRLRLRTRYGQVCHTAFLVSAMRHFSLVLSHIQQLTHSRRWRFLGFPPADGHGTQ